ncbi:MAG: ribonuclease III [Bacteroidales bacterium]
MFGFIRAYLSKEDKNLYLSIKNILGFYPENIFLYKLAFKHKSASIILRNGTRRNNERLEFLGDSVLSTVVAYYLYKKYPNQAEGFLTEMRSKIVSRANLNQVALKMGLHQLLDFNQHANTIYKSADGDAFEALIGAIFLDKGYAFTQKIIIQRIIQLHVNIQEMEHTDWNYKSKIIDWGQKNKQKVVFQVVEVLEHAYQKQYRVEVFVQDKTLGTGLSSSIKAAEQIAAEHAYKEHLETKIASNI